MANDVRDDDTTIGPAQERARQAPAPTLRVVFSGGFVRNELHALRAGDTPIGRGVDSVTGVRLDSDARVSRTHAVIGVRGASATLHNRSQHGTTVNGVPIGDDGVALRDGDVLRWGETFAVFRLVPPDIVDAPALGGPRILGASPAAAAIRAAVRTLGGTDASVLLLGATGTGKELMAQALHEASGRRGPFVAVNASAIPESLAESLLFGHVAGSFTGAKADHVGVFRQAHGGTLFFDEIGDLPLGLQPKLLRALDEQRVTPVGAQQPQPVDVRLVCATNAELEQRVRAGTFRADLFARISSLAVRLPPLVDRREDVLMLLEASLPAQHPPLDAPLVSALLLHSWPYNVREVQKVAAELGVRGAGHASYPLELVEERLRSAAGDPADNAGRAAAPAQSTEVRTEDDDDDARVPVPDRDSLLKLLEEHNGVIADVARATGRSRKQVYRWLDRHGLRSRQ